MCDRCAVNADGSTERERRSRQAASFGAAAAAYERGRPSYPPEALDWLLPPDAQTVLDLGAGTGKLTRSLVARGLGTLAVDPSEPMLAELRRTAPEVDARVGTGEAIPVADGSVDVVLVAQAWHWVDPALALPEVHRVLRPGGSLGLVWNMRDNRTPWVAELSTIITGPDWLQAVADVELSDRFAPVERAEFSWTHHLSRADLLDMVASRSYVIIAPEDERAATRQRVADLVDRRPELSGAPSIPLPYVTVALRSVRRDQ